MTDEPLTGEPVTESAVPDRLYVADVARVARLAEATIRKYHRRANQRRDAGRGGDRGLLPRPDGYEFGRGGIRRPWWKESTVTTWISQRPGKPIRNDLAPRDPEHPDVLGASWIDLVSEQQPAQRVYGRVAATDLPCCVGAGCGGEHTMIIIRTVLPDAEGRVGAIEHCTVCGPAAPRTVAPTPRELDNAWASPADR